MSEKYKSIMALPHHVSKTRPQMSELERAAQFSPFAALTGYDAAIDETGRLTDSRIEIGEAVQEELNIKQQIILEHIKERPEVQVTYFVPDKKKAGGAYVTVTGNVKRLDELERLFIMTDGKKISMDDIIDIESKIIPVLRATPHSS